MYSTHRRPVSEPDPKAGPPKGAGLAKRPVRKPRARKTPPRMRARWGIFDGAMKQIATPDHNERAAAETSLADLQVRKKGVHFLQIVKEAMPAAAAVE